jgi:hypothetical protein
MEDMSRGDENEMRLLRTSGIPSNFSLLKKSKKSLKCSLYKVFVSWVRSFLKEKHKSQDWTFLDPSRPIGK